MIDVPVMIRNYYSNGLKPNEFGTNPESTWKLVRRFFILDSISGVEEGQTMTKPKFIRYPKIITLKVMMDTETKEAIYRPLLIIEYAEIEVAKQSPDAQYTLYFESEYFSDYSWVLRQITIAFIIFNTAALVVIIIRFFMYTGRNPKKELGNDINKMYFSKFIFYFCDVWSEFMFWLIFWSCGSIFIRFKLQENATQLLPETGESALQVFMPFYIVGGLTVVTKSIAVLMRIYWQVNIDIFIVDLEKPHMQTKMVNAWRHYFVANEFSELQSGMRYIYPEVTLVWFIFLWVGLGWKNWCIADPYFTNKHDDDNISSLILEFFMAGFILMCITSIQVLINRLSSFSWGAKINSFVDLCTLANCSMIMMYEHGYGFYIHGQAPWSSSDIPLDWMLRQLQEEGGKNNTFSNTRALKNSPKDSKAKQIQTLQIFMPNELRK